MDDSFSEYVDSGAVKPAPAPDLIDARRDRSARRVINPLSIDRLPPHSEEAELGVLGCVMLSPRDTVAECLARNMSSEWFYSLQNQTIWDAVEEMFNGGEPIDLITLQQKLKDNKLLDQVGGLAYLGGLTDAVPSAANIGWYADFLRDKYLLRRVVRVCTDAVSRVYEFEGEVDELLDQIETSILKISQQRDSKEVRAIGDIVPEATAEIESSYNTAGTISGISTGFPDYDLMTDGLQLREALIIAARPSLGKTSLLMNMAENVAMQKIPVGIFSLEMSSKALVKRCILSGAKVNLRRIRNGDVGEDDFNNITNTAARLRPAPIYIDDTPGLSIMQLRAKARRMVQRYGVKVIGIDYLQLMHSTNKKAQNRQQEISDISGGAKALAKELDVAVIILSQLNREMDKEKGRKPRLSDLRESGAIEQDGDVIAMLYRPSFGENDKGRDDAATMEDIIPVNLLIAKQRNGPTGDVPLTFFKSFTRFESTAKIDDRDVPARQTRQVDSGDAPPPDDQEIPIE